MYKAILLHHLPHLESRRRQVGALSGYRWKKEDGCKWMYVLYVARQSDFHEVTSKRFTGEPGTALDRMTRTISERQAYRKIAELVPTCSFG